MTSKLTLTIEDSTIKKAKQYAQRSGRSLSHIVQIYLEALIKDDDPVSKDCRLEELFGCIQLDPEVSDKELIRSIALERNS